MTAGAFADRLSYLYFSQTRNFLGENSQSGSTDVLKKLASYGSSFGGGGCSEALNNCVSALDDLADLPKVDSYSKAFCGEDLATPRTIGAGDNQRDVSAKVGLKKNTLHTDRIVGLDGKDKGKISVRGGVITIASTDRNKPALKIRLGNGEQGNSLQLFQGSQRATEPLLGSLQTLGGKCPSAPTCDTGDREVPLDLSQGGFEISSRDNCIFKANSRRTRTDSAPTAR